MKLYLVQHGLAKSKDEDPERPLTADGGQAVERIGAWASRRGLAVDEIRHSGKRRAAETAEILGSHLGPPSRGVSAVTGLAPLDDVHPVGHGLDGETGAIMLVGHLPFLARLAGLLLAGSAEASPVSFTNGGIVCLERGDQGWALAWAVPPELVD